MGTLFAHKSCTFSTFADISNTEHTWPPITNITFISGTWDSRSTICFTQVSLSNFDWPEVWKIVQMNRLQLESFNEISDWKVFWYELTCQEKHTIGHLGRQIPYKPWCLLQIVDNLCEPDPAWRIPINGILNGIVLAGFDHIGLSHPKKTNSFCATNNSVENTVKWCFYISIRESI